MREYLPAAVIFAFSVIWGGVFTFWPRDGQPVAVFYGTAGGADAALSRVVAAGADDIRGFGRIPELVIASSDQPQFIKKLYHGGALVVLRAPVVADCAR